MKLYSVYEGATGASTSSNAAVLGEEVVGVAATPTVGKQETSLSTLVEIEPGHISWTDPLVLNLRTLIWKYLECYTATAEIFRMLNYLQCYIQLNNKNLSKENLCKNVEG